MSELATTSGELNEIVAAAGQQVHSDQMFDSISAGGTYLPRLQLMGSGSDEVKQGKISVAHWAFITSKDNLIDLGTEVDVLPLLWRPKAMDLNDPIVTSFDTASDEFKRIQVKSEVKESKCMFGPEFLVWVPQVNKWATYFASSKTARRAAPNVRDRLGKPMTFKAEYIKTKTYSWHGPIHTPCSTPFDLPTTESVIEESEKFNNPPKSDIEKIDNTAATGGRVR